MTDKKKRSPRSRRKFWRIFGVVIGIIIIIGIFVGGTAYENIRETARDIHAPVVQKSKSNKTRDLTTLLKEKKPINILLLGTDTGALGRNWKGRTDTIMMLAINPKTDKTTIISIPRDSNAIFPGYPQYGVTKINSAYTLGGASETIKTLDKYYSVPIDGYVLMNMNGMTKAINHVGKITVTSPLTFNNMGYKFVKGKTYHMDGKMALAFVQMRHGDPKQDYGRQDRNRLVIAALLKKSLSVKSLFNKKFLKALSSGMQTDLTLLQMYKIVKNYRHSSKNVEQDHAQGVSKSTNNPKFGTMSIEVISRSERQRISNKLRQTLGLAKVEVAANKASYVMRR